MPDLVQRIRKNLESHRLLPRDGRLVVAVSGGLDSMVLLSVLQALSERDGLHLTVAHANHQLRGAESDADAAFVTSAATRAGLPSRVAQLAVRESLERSQESLEMIARRWRHRFLAATAREFKIHTVALAHHADDQVELILLRLLRGAGGQGLGGMDWANPSPADPKIRLIRPLLDISRRELSDYAQAHGISFRQDSSNANLTIPRNRIRHELRPLLEQEYNPALGAALQRTAQVVGADADFVAQSAERWLKSTRRTHFGRLHVAVQRAVIRQQLWALGHDVDFDQVERLRAQTTKVTVRNAVKIRRTGEGSIAPTVTDKTAAFTMSERRVHLMRARKEIQFGGKIIRWKFTKATNARQATGTTTERFDAPSIGGGVILRHWRPGDRFQPLGFPRPAKVQNLLVNRKIAAAKRRELLVASDLKGEVFWIEGLPPGERFKVHDQTRRVLRWSWSPLQ